MNSIFLLVLITSTAIGGGLLTILNSVRIINEGNEALVERFGQYNRKLNAGLNMVLPLFETIVVEETLREKVLDIEPQEAISKDNVSLRVGAVVYWKIMDLEMTFYAVEDIQTAIKSLVITTLRSQIGQLQLDETYSSRKKINQNLIEIMDEATGPWGVKITRIEVREISPAKRALESLELERAAESKKRAELLESQGTEGSIKTLAGALAEIENLAREKGSGVNAQQILDYLVAQRYLDAQEKLATSTNAKIIFMDPRGLDEAVTDLMKQKPGAALPLPDAPNAPSSPPANGSAGKSNGSAG